MIDSCEVVLEAPADVFSGTVHRVEASRGDVTLILADDH